VSAILTTNSLSSEPTTARSLHTKNSQRRAFSVPRLWSPVFLWSALLAKARRPHIHPSSFLPLACTGTQHSVGFLGTYFQKGGRSRTLTRFWKRPCGVIASTCVGGHRSENETAIEFCYRRFLPPDRWRLSAGGPRREIRTQADTDAEANRTRPRLTILVMSVAGLRVALIALP
jgi:hypothetical protein